MSSARFFLILWSMFAMHSDTIRCSVDHHLETIRCGVGESCWSGVVAPRGHLICQRHQRFTKDGRHFRCPIDGDVY